MSSRPASSFRTAADRSSDCWAARATDSRPRRDAAGRIESGVKDQQKRNRRRPAGKEGGATHLSHFRSRRTRQGYGGVREHDQVLQHASRAEGALRHARRDEERHDRGAGDRDHPDRGKIGRKRPAFGAPRQDEEWQEESRQPPDGAPAGDRKRPVRRWTKAEGSPSRAEARSCGPPRFRRFFSPEALSSSGDILPAHCVIVRR